ncbi:hepatocyte growth factor receptor-like [Haliotis asinina]|uniref:hepatocyte growth factor receptor-like n=1 Tax=Haliotis asinina TaxID=109174 RepID=UPI0035324CD1
MEYCKERCFSLLICVISLSLVVGTHPFFNDSIDEVIRDTKTGHVYTAGNEGITHWSENLTFISGVDWGDGENGHHFTAMALFPDLPQLLACSTALGGLCAVYNTSNITQRWWMDNKTDSSYINTKSVLLFTDKDKLIVASSFDHNSKSAIHVLSYRHVPPPPEPKMIIGDMSIVSRASGNSNTLKFISGFTKGNFTYLLTTQREMPNTSVSTRLITFCTGDNFLLPVTDISLDCITRDFTSFNLGLDMADTGSSITVSFGRNANESIFEEDNRLGSALCQYQFGALENVRFDARKQLDSVRVTWTNATVKCENGINETMCRPGQSQSVCYIEDNPMLFNKLQKKFNSVYSNQSTLIDKFLSSEDGRIIAATSSGDILQFKTTEDGNLTLNDDVSDGFRQFHVVVRSDKRFLRLFNLTEEVDICRGKRCEECSLKRRCSWCEGCMFKEACGKNKCKVQKWYPKEGPKSGGTVITFEGCDFNTTDQQINAAGRKCVLKEHRSTTVLKCEVEKLDPDANSSVQKKNEKVVFQDCSLGYFTFKPDPNITNISPKTSIQSGGLTVTVTGKHFDLVQQPRIELIVNNETRKGSCTPNETSGADKVYCETPCLPTKNRTTGILSVIMGMVTRDFNFTVYPDPKIVLFRDTEIEEGSRLNIHAKLDGVTKTDVRVEIGRSNCTDVHVNSTLISCMPDWMVDVETPQNVTVKVGSKLSLYVGQVTFVIRTSNPDLIIGIAVTSAVVVIIVVVVAAAVAAVIIKKNKSSLHSRLQAELTSTTTDDRAVNNYFLLEPRVKETLSPELMQRIEQNKVIVDFSRLQLGATIGSGNFGCVYEGLLHTDANDEDRVEKVAIKSMQDNNQNMDLASFVEEALVMKSFDHENVLRLLGISVNESQQPMVILPFMSNGDLMSYVSKDTKEVRVFDILRWGVDIAEGMNYLSSLKLVHRDLAARNCMLDDNLHVKVADFGLCRDIYEKGYYSSDNKKKLPIRWMAPESMERGSYSSKSDVWSLGVVLWEMLTRGSVPYPGVEGWDIGRYLQYGRRLQQPWFCSNELYSLMLEIWSQDPAQRPTFSEVSEALTALLKLTSDQKVTAESKDDGYVTFPQCYRYVELRVPEYFVLETGASAQSAHMIHQEQLK